MTEIKFDRVKKSVFSLLERAGVSKGVKFILSHRGIEIENVKHPPSSGPVSSWQISSRMEDIALTNGLRLETGANVSFLMYPPENPPKLPPPKLLKARKIRVAKK